MVLTTAETIAATIKQKLHHRNYYIIVRNNLKVLLRVAKNEFVIQKGVQLVNLASARGITCLSMVIL